MYNMKNNRDEIELHVLFACAIAARYHTREKEKEIHHESRATIRGTDQVIVEHDLEIQHRRRRRRRRRCDF